MTASNIIQRKFDFIDAMPGAGKTEYFVSRAVRLLQDPNPKTNLIYVAPTVLLIIEALERIRSHPKFDQRTQFRISIVASADRLVDVQGQCRTFVERPVKAISRILGLEAGDLMFGGTKVPPIDVGHIVMTTHETFVQVPNVDRTGNDFAILRRSDVIFDEARQCVMESRTARDLSQYDLAVMGRRLFTLNNRPIEDSPWFVYEVTNAPTQEQMLAGFNTKRLKNVRQTIHRLRAEVRRFADRGRASVFLMTTVDLGNKKGLDKIISHVEGVSHDPSKPLPDELVTHAVVTTLLRPTSLFNHYRRVILTSAFFKDSQMYHFLKQDGHTFRNLSQLRETSKSIRAIYDRDQILRDSLSKRLLVAPLLTEPRDTGRKTSTYRNVLTAGLLEKGMVVPSQVSSEITAASLNQNYSLSELIDTVRSGGIVSNSDKTQRLLERFCVPPLWILINECALIVKWAFQTGLLASSAVEEANDCLLVFNVKARYWYSVPATAVVNRIYEEGRLRVSSGSARRSRMKGAVSKNALAKKCPPEWEARLAKHLFVDSPTAVFTSSPSTKLHGLNEYVHLRAFAHLAALNPTPSMIALYSALLGDTYDIDLDHSIENLVQTLYRTSLRNPSLTENVLLIVPYRAQAELLEAKVQCAPFTYVREPRLSAWVYRKSQNPKSLSAARSAGGKRTAELRSLKMTDEERSRYKSLSAGIRRYRKNIKDLPSDVRRNYWEQRIKDLTKEKHSMVFTAKTKEL